MSNWENDVFLSGGANGAADLTDGSANLNIHSITIQNLQPDLPLKTNASKKLVSTLLNISDTANLQAELDAKISNQSRGLSSREASPLPV